MLKATSRQVGDVIIVETTGRRTIDSTTPIKDQVERYLSLGHLKFVVDYSRAVEDYPGESLLSLIKVNESGGEMVFVATDANQDLEAPEDYEPLDLKGFFHETEEAMRKKGSSRILFESVDEALEYLSDD